MIVRMDYDYSVVYNNGKGNVTIEFNICDHTLKSCPDGGEDYAHITNQNNTCDHMSTKSISDIDVQLIQRQVPELGLTLTYKDGNQCNETSNYGLILQMNCDQYATRTTYSLDT
jgi:hypothetical protein